MDVCCLVFHSSRLLAGKKIFFCILKPVISLRNFDTLTFSFGTPRYSPLIGILLDRIGVRKTSILVYFASAASYWILANATSTHWLYWSKVPTIFQHAFLVGQATVASASARKSSDCLDGGDKQRAVALGRMSTFQSIRMIAFCLVLHCNFLTTFLFHKYYSNCLHNRRDNRTSSWRIFGNGRFVCRR